MTTIILETVANVACEGSPLRVQEDYSAAKRAAQHREELLSRNCPDVMNLIRDAYALGYLEGMKAERKRLTEGKEQSR